MLCLLPLLLLPLVTTMTIEQHRQHRQAYFKKKRQYPAPNYLIRETEGGVYEARYFHDSKITKNLIERLVINITQESHQVVHLSIRPRDKKMAFGMPGDNDVLGPMFMTRDHSVNKTSLYRVEADNQSSLKIIRNANNETIFSLTNLMYSKYNKEVSYEMPTKQVIGMGERNNRLVLKENSIYTLMARDTLADLETGRSPGHNTYSSMPIYLAQEKDRHSHLVYIRNPNAMDFVLGEGNA